MIPIKMVGVPSKAFKFCSGTLLFLFLMALLWQSKEWVWVGFVLLVLSSILRIQKAPLILLYQLTFGRFLKSEEIYFDEHAIFFAHLFATILSGGALILLYFVNELVGWGVVGILILAKTSAFFGYCGAAKLYSCLNSDNRQCCRFGRKVKTTCRLDK